MFESYGESAKRLARNYFFEGHTSKRWPSGNQNPHRTASEQSISTWKGFGVSLGLEFRDLCRARVCRVISGKVINKRAPSVSGAELLDVSGNCFADSFGDRQKTVDFHTDGSAYD
jgi:hypothetical protein